MERDLKTLDRQIEANRANAKKSTRPKTEAGKRRSRQNSRKHGLTAEVLVVADEDAEEFRELREGLMEQYDPQVAMECELVEQIAGILWRLRRVPVFEAAAIDFRVDQVREQQRKREQEAWERRERQHQIVAQSRGENAHEEAEEQEQDEEDEGAALFESSVTLGDALTTDFAYTNSLHKLGRHETSLMNSLTKTQQMLSDLQSSRRQTERPPPQRPRHPLPDCGRHRSHVSEPAARSLQGASSLRRQSALPY